MREETLDISPVWFMAKNSGNIGYPGGHQRGSALQAIWRSAQSAANPSPP